MIEAAQLVFSMVNLTPMSARKRNLRYDFRLYLNANGQRVLGKGGAQILEAVDEYGSITAAAEELEMSYKFTWDYLIRMTRRLHEPVIVTRRGGTQNGKKKGGGGTTLTPIARTLLREFRATERLVRNTLTKRETATARSISSRWSKPTQLRV
jgi:molybdate transport system regulatory protein